jgi:hypothetical protein
MNPWKKDLIAALLIGLIAGPLSLVFVANNNINVPWYLLLIGFPVLTITGIVVARILSSVWGTFYKLGKFSEVGGLNFLVDLGVINLLVLVSGVAVGFLTLVYKAISFVLLLSTLIFGISIGCLMMQGSRSKPKRLQNSLWRAYLV